ncbi:MAG: DUF6498-containing protein [Burkholderiales bacterium]
MIYLPSWRRVPATALIAANLVVAVITLLRGWGYYEIIIVYWCEAVIIGGFNFARMCMVGLAGEPFGRWVGADDLTTRFFLVLLVLGFYIVKFGGFALTMGLLIAAVPAFLAHAGDTGTREIWHGLRAVGGGVAMAVAALFISHGISFVVNFLLGREYANANLLVLLFWPYVRMSLVMVTLAAGLVAAALFPALDASATFGVAIVLIKLAADLIMHTIEHNSFSRTKVAA